MIELTTANDIQEFTKIVQGVDVMFGWKEKMKTEIIGNFRQNPCCACCYLAVT